MQQSDIARYLLWCGIAATAAGNRRQYRMITTWLPHLLTNSLTLLLPDLYCRLNCRNSQAPSDPGNETWQLIHATILKIVCHNPRYVIYVTPLAAGYLLSSPWLNIYKGGLGQLRLAGFGLDTVPHSATAFALTALICDTVEAASGNVHAAHPLAPLLRWCARRQALVSGSALALATVLWECGEYLMHQYEMALQGDPEKINMQWSLRDSLYDCASNAAGWACATAWRRQRRPPG